MSLTLEDLTFENTYAGLGEDFFSWQAPLPFDDLLLTSRNQAAFDLLNLNLSTTFFTKLLLHILPVCSRGQVVNL